MFEYFSRSTSAFIGFILLLGFLNSGCMKFCSDRDFTLYNEAQNLWIKNKPDEAIPKLMVIIENDHNDLLIAKSLLMLGDIYYLKYDEVDRAIDFYKRAARSTADRSIALKASENIAEIYFSDLRNYDLAILQYNEIISSFSDLVSVDFYLFKIAGSYLAKQDYYQSELEYAKLLKEYPDTVLKLDILYNIGNCRYFSGNIEGARKVFDEILRDYPDSKYDFDINLSTGMIYEESNNLSKSLEIYTKMKEKYPEKSELMDIKISSVKRRINKIRK